MEGAVIAKIIATNETPNEIIDHLTEEDCLNLELHHQRPLIEIVKAILFHRDSEITRDAHRLAVANTYGINSKEYLELMNIENEKPFKRHV